MQAVPCANFQLCSNLWWVERSNGDDVGASMASILSCDVLKIIMKGVIFTGPPRHRTSSLNAELDSMEQQIVSWTRSGHMKHHQFLHSILTLNLRAMHDAVAALNPR